MTPEQFDALIRGQAPPVDLSDARMDRLAEAVLRQIDRQPPPRRFFWTWLNPLPNRGFAMLLLASAVLGLLLGNHWDEAQAVPELGTLLTSSLYYPIGS